ncbi:hypothetical protein JXL19_03560 [bacterium]|nr:hypothetical protein [bacterium]
MGNSKVKNLTWIALIGAMGIAAFYFALVYPFILNKRVNEKLEIEEQRLENYLRTIRQKPEKDAMLEHLIQSEERYQDMLMEPDKPPVVAARLQNTLKGMAENEGVNIISEKQLAISEQGAFIEVPVEITLRCSITKLTNLIYAIEDYQRFLDISKLNIRVVNIRNPIDIRADMTVSGFILARGISEEG